MATPGPTPPHRQTPRHLTSELQLGGAVPRSVRKRVELGIRGERALASAAARFYEEGPFEVRARTSNAEFENASVLVRPTRATGSRLR